MSHTMNTRTTHQLCTRSGKRYQRPTQESHFSALPIKNPNTTQFVASEPTSSLEVQEEPETQVFSTFTLYHPNGEVEFKEITFEEWVSEVKHLLQHAFEMTEDEMVDYPFYNWFLENMEPMAVANHIRRDFFRDEDEYYLQPFYQWQQEVDELVNRHLGMSRLDLPDFPFYDCFHEMVKPMEMVNYMRQSLMFV
mgnify:CR=1 FL=1